MTKEEELMKARNSGFEQGYKHSQPSPETIRMFNEMDKRIGNIEKDVATVKTDVSWLKKFFWVVMTASIGTLIAQLFQLIFK